MGCLGHTPRSRVTPCDTPTAINGTPCGIDPQRGIDPAIFQATLDHLDPTTLHKFYRRMCNDRHTLDPLLETAPERGIESLRTELAAIGDAIARHPVPGFSWTRPSSVCKTVSFRPKTN